MNHEMNRAQSKNHNIGNYRIIKVALPCYDNKNIYLKVNTMLINFHKSTC